MFRIFFYILIASLIAFGLGFMLDNQGMVTIVWLGYEIKTSILTAIFVSIFLVFALFVVIYLFAKLFSIKLPKFSKKKSDI